MVLDKKTIIAAKDLKRETVEVPEWGDGAQIIIGELSAGDRLKFGHAVTAEENQGKLFVSNALTWFIINEDGSRMFDESDAEDLAGKSMDVLTRLFHVAEKLNKIGKAVEKEIKN
jgi:hypothetical protein